MVPRLLFRDRGPAVGVNTQGGLRLRRSWGCCPFPFLDGLGQVRDLVDLLGRQDPTAYLVLGVPGIRVNIPLWVRLCLQPSGGQDWVLGWLGALVTYDSQLTAMHAC